MREKEKSQLKKRLLGLVINEPPYPHPITMSEVMVNDMSKPNIKPLLNFIEQEIDKAREDGRKNIFTKEESRVIRWAFRNMEEQINTVWDEETYNQIEKKLEYYLN